MSIGRFESPFPTQFFIPPFKTRKTRLERLTERLERLIPGTLLLKKGETWHFGMKMQVDTDELLLT